MNTKPKAIRTGHMLPRQILVGVLSLAVFIEAFVLVGGIGFLNGGNNLASVLPGVVAALTNGARTDESLAPLAESEVLAKGAQMKADDMAAKGYFSHTGPDGSLPWKWFKEAGYQYEYAGENLAVNFAESEDVVDAWLKSPTHRANILKREFTEVGIATATGTYKGKEAVFVVQFFGKPGVAQGHVNDAQASTTRPEDFLASSAVLGTSTQNIISQLASSPMTEEKQVFIGLLGIVVLLLVAGLLFGKRFPKLWPTISVLLALSVLLGFAILNRDVLLGETVVEHAAP